MGDVTRLPKVWRNRLQTVRNAPERGHKALLYSKIAQHQLTKFHQLDSNGKIVTGCGPVRSRAEFGHHPIGQSRLAAFELLRLLAYERRFRIFPKVGWSAPVNENYRSNI